MEKLCPWNSKCIMTASLRDKASLNWFIIRSENNRCRQIAHSPYSTTRSRVMTWIQAALSLSSQRCEADQRPRFVTSVRRSESVAAPSVVWHSSKARSRHMISSSPMVLTAFRSTGWLYWASRLLRLPSTMCKSRRKCHPFSMNRLPCEWSTR